MDDFILILKTKKQCIDTKEQIEKFLHKKLHLELNSKSKYYPDKMGVNYCGYRTFTTHRLLRLNSKKKIKRNVKFWNHLYNRNTLDMQKALQQINSWKGHSQHCDSYNLTSKILNNCKFILSNNTYKEIEKNLISQIEGKENQ